MVKIKTKKEMTLSELVEWGWENLEQVRGKDFKSSVRDSFGNYSIVQFSVDGYGFKTDSVSHKDTFAVEIEQPITEDMEFHIVERFISRYEGKPRYISYFKKSIKSVLKDIPAHVETTHIYAELNNELVLIWENGRLVE